MEEKEIINQCTRISKKWYHCTFDSSLYENFVNVQFRKYLEDEASGLCLLCLGIDRIGNLVTEIERRSTDIVEKSLAQSLLSRLKYIDLMNPRNWEIPQSVSDLDLILNGESIGKNYLKRFYRNFPSVAFEHLYRYKQNTPTFSSKFPTYVLLGYLESIYEYALPQYNDEYYENHCCQTISSFSEQEMKVWEDKKAQSIEQLKYLVESIPLAGQYLWYLDCEIAAKKILQVLQTKSLTTEERKILHRIISHPKMKGNDEVVQYFRNLCFTKFVNFPHLNYYGGWNFEQKEAFITLTKFGDISIVPHIYAALSNTNQYRFDFVETCVNALFKLFPAEEKFIEALRKKAQESTLNQISTCCIIRHVCNWRGWNDKERRAEYLSNVMEIMLSIITNGDDLAITALHSLSVFLPKLISKKWKDLNISNEMEIILELTKNRKKKVIEAVLDFINAFLKESLHSNIAFSEKMKETIGQFEDHVQIDPIISSFLKKRKRTEEVNTNDKRPKIEL